MADTGLTEEIARRNAEYTWALQNAELYTLLWIIAILAIFVPLSVRTYQNSMR